MPRDYEPIEVEDTPRRSLIRVLIIAGVAFLGGVIGMGWFLVNYGPSLGILGSEASETASPESSAAVAALERQLCTKLPARVCCKQRLQREDVGALIGAPEIRVAKSGTSR